MAQRTVETPLALQVDRPGSRRQRERRNRGHRRTLREPRLLQVGIDPAEEPAHAPLGLAHRPVQIVRKEGVRALEACQPTGDRHAGVVENAEIDVLAAVGAAQRQARRPPGSVLVGDLVDRAVELAQHPEPVPDVTAAVATRDTCVVAHGDHDLPSRLPELERQLLAAGPGADDQHAARGSPSGTQ